MPEFSGTAAASAFEREWLGDNADSEDALVAGGFGDDRRGASARATTHASGDEAHVSAFERGRDVVDCLFSGGAPDFGTGACTEFLGDLEAELDATIGQRSV